MIGITGFVGNTDSMPDYDKFSNTPQAAGASHTTLNNSNSIEGSLIFEMFLKEYIKEVLNETRGKSISGNYYLNKAGHSGKLYPPKNVDAHLSPVSKSYNVNRVTQASKGFNMPTSSGIKAMNNMHIEDEKNFDELDDNENITSFEFENIKFGEEKKKKDDENNLNKHNRLVKVLFNV